MFDSLRWQRQTLLDPESGEPTDASLGSNESSSLCPRLSYYERLIGCLTCFLVGFLLSLGSTFRLARLLHGHPAPFAIAYTVGNLLSLGSTTFFVGPSRQLQTMFHAKRRSSAIVYVTFMVVTLVLCVAPRLRHRMGCVLLSLLVQFMALIWYTLSFVPYGRTIAKRSCRRCVGGAANDEL